MGPHTPYPQADPRWPGGWHHTLRPTHPSFSGCGVGSFLKERPLEEKEEMVSAFTSGS